MSEMGMVEKGASAILARVPAGYGMTEADAREYARAVIETMREPTEAMVSAANTLNHPRDEEIWTTMVDAALKP